MSHGQNLSSTSGEPEFVTLHSNSLEFQPLVAVASVCVIHITVHVMHFLHVSQYSVNASYSTVIVHKFNFIWTLDNDIEYAPQYTCL